MSRESTHRLIALGAVVLAGAALLGITVPTAANALGVRQALVATGADPDAAGKAALQVRKRRGTLQGQLTVAVKRVDGARSFEVTVDGVRLGTLESNRRGKGTARFRTVPRSAKVQLLGIDPRGRTLALVRDDGVPVLLGALSNESLADGDVRCCLPDDSGPECEDRTAAECAAQGGIDLGPGSCLLNPCEGPTPGTEVVCCLPDDSGPECEDRTAAGCAAQGGVRLAAITCMPNPCAPLAPPDGDVRCCLPDDSGTHCEDRTAGDCAAQGGVNLGPGSCTPNPCFPGGPTSTTLPAPPLARVTCERRADRSRVSVAGDNLPAGSYAARATSGGNTATTGLAPTVGDEVEFDFDSQPDDIAAGATAIAIDFLEGTPPQATGTILDTAENVVASSTVICSQR